MASVLSNNNNNKKKGRQVRCPATVGAGYCVFQTKLSVID